MDFDAVRDRKLIHENRARQDGFSHVIGIDEAGRGPLAGPVVAAAVLLRTPRFSQKIDDSKLLSPSRREDAFHEILENGFVGIGVMNESVIDEHNILQATFLAMNNAVTDLIARLPAGVIAKRGFNKKVCLLIDGGHFRSQLPYAARCIVKGDSLSLSIASASIVAKVIRDRMMRAYDKVFPQYGFFQHKGYPTPDHKEAIRKHGLSLIHRRTFNAV